MQARAVGGKVLGAVRADGALQQVDGLRVDEMVLAVQRTPGGKAQGSQLVRCGRAGDRLRRVVAALHLVLDLGQVKSANAAYGAGEVAVDKAVRKTDRLEDLGGMVALRRGDAHLGHDAHHARDGGSVVVGDGLLGAQRAAGCVCKVALLRHCRDLGMGFIREDAAGRVANQGGEVVRGQCVAAFHNNVCKGAKAAPNEVVVDGGHG